jgi:hypothetical protein
MDDETVGSTQYENTDHNSNQLSLKISRWLMIFTSIRAN